MNQGAVVKTYELKDDSGNLHAFEIPHMFFSSNGIARFIARCKGCEIVKIRRFFSREEEHVFFKFQGNEFVVWEPFGDNSRLYMGFVDSNKNDSPTVIKLIEAVKLTPRFGIFKFFKPENL